MEERWRAHHPARHSLRESWEKREEGTSGSPTTLLPRSDFTPAVSVPLRALPSNSPVCLRPARKRRSTPGSLTNQAACSHGAQRTASGLSSCALCSEASAGISWAAESAGSLTAAPDRRDRPQQLVRANAKQDHLKHAQVRTKGANRISCPFVWC